MNSTHAEIREDLVQIPTGKVILDGILAIPSGAKGIVLFAHGSGSSRFSPRNNAVAQSLQNAGIATLLFDLLVERESYNRGNVFDIKFLAQRLLTATDWVSRNRETFGLKLGYFGASTGAAAALVAAAVAEESIHAVVSRGGRPDLAGDFLHGVHSPTLLIVGGHDDEVLELNQKAFAELTCEKNLTVVPGATHLFEEPGALDNVIRLAAEWFQFYMGYEATLENR